MPDDIAGLRSKVQRRDQAREDSKTIANLRKRISELEEEKAKNAILKKEADASTSRDDEVDGIDEGDDHGLPEPIYDEADDVYRCTECAWEIVEGFCEGCQTEFEWEDVENDSESLIPADSLYTDPTYDSDRMQAPRGDTPLPNVGPFRPLPGYTREMYMALLQRGATRLMIETFKLHFTPEHGIFAWADATLYDEFSGPAMLNGDCWKIQLGRRFDLDEDDLDGAAFIEGILEEAVMFPKVPQQWETVLECPGVWVTRMVADWVAAAAADEDDEDDDDKNDDGEDDANADDDDADDDDDDDEDMDKEAREYHIRCGDLPLEDNGPVRRCPGYDTSDDHGSDDEMNAPIGEDGSVTQSDDVDMEEDMGWAFSASAPDGDFDPGSDEKDEPVPRGANVEGQEPVPRNQENVNLAGEGNPTEANDSTTLDRDDSMNDTDSVDSDFDDDEILSGDEELAAHAAIVMNFKYTYGDGRRAPGQ